MKNGYIDVRGCWGVVISYDFGRLDEYEMRSMMISLGMRGKSIDDAVEILLNEKNTGFCVSNDRLQMSFVFIGNATNKEQFWDTVIHELYHVQQAICKYYDVEADTEDGAWTMGYLMRKTVEEIAEPCV